MIFPLIFPLTRVFPLYFGIIQFQAETRKPLQIRTFLIFIFLNFRQVKNSNPLTQTI